MEANIPAPLSVWDNIYIIYNYIYNIYIYENQSCNHQNICEILSISSGFLKIFFCSWASPRILTPQKWPFWGPIYTPVKNRFIHPSIGGSLGILRGVKFFKLAEPRSRSSSIHRIHGTNGIFTDPWMLDFWGQMSVSIPILDPTGISPSREIISDIIGKKQMLVDFFLWMYKVYKYTSPMDLSWGYHDWIQKMLPLLYEARRFDCTCSNPLVELRIV